jgi:starch phosphorylase
MTERIGAVSGKDNVVPTDVDGVDALVELALDLRSSWNHGADALWNALDSELWVATRNPWAVLQTVSRDRLRGLLGDTTFRRRLDETLPRRRKTLESPAWFQRTHPGSALRAVAYFSMEFMLSEALPIYSGGSGT